MNTIRIYARAKINLTLDVLKKRPDGYHDVKMIMQTIKLADIVDVTLTQTGEIELRTNLSYLPTNNKNIAYKACELFLSETHVAFTGVHINIFKKIPVSAGLAGGSTNAAAVLIALNKLYKTNLPMSKLMEMGGKLGADVPFCIHGGTMLSEGVGDKLTKLRPMPLCKIVLCKPAFSVSTAKVYSQISAEKIEHRPDTNSVIDCLNKRDYIGITKRLYNVLEEVTSKNHKEINEIKKELLNFSPNGVLMSGSGPTVFALFNDEKKAIEAVSALRKSYRDVHISDISNYINEV